MDQLTSADPAYIGPYRLIARLGEGGMGLVYLGRSQAGRTVAVKVVQAEYAQHPEFRSRFAREVAAARRVGGAWTADVLDADTEAAVPWVATQYIAGPDLTTVVGRDHGPLPEHSVRVLAHRLAQALRSVHEAGLIHRDLKPSNVLVTVDGPRVIDFGIARAMDSLTGDSLHTRTGMLVGSPGFMSPEQVRGRELTPASDVFCLGAVLVHAATGRFLFGATETGLHAHLFRVAEEEPDLSGVPEALLPLVEQCLRKEPAERPALAEVVERTASWVQSDEEWLPGSVLAQLGRKAAELLDFAPETRMVPDPGQVQGAGAAQYASAPGASHPAYGGTPAPGGQFGPAPGAVPPPPAWTPTAAAHPGGAFAAAPTVGPGYAPQDTFTPHPLRWWGLVALALAQLSVLLVPALLMASPGTLLSELGLPVSDLDKLFLFHGLPFAFLLFTGAHLGDLLGRKKVLAVGLVLTALAFLLVGAVPEVETLFWAAALHGAGSALVLPAALGLVSVNFPGRVRPAAFAVQGAIAVVGPALSLAFAGVLLGRLEEYATWFTAAAVLAVLGAVGSAMFVSEGPRRSLVRLDMPGLVSGTGAATLLWLGLHETANARQTDEPWQDPVAMGALLAGAVLLAVFAFRQISSPDGLTGAQVLKDRTRLGACLALLFAGTALGILFLLLPGYLQASLGYAPEGAGALMLPLVVAAVLAAVPAAALLPRMAPRDLIVPGLVLMAIGLGIMTRLNVEVNYVAGVLPGLILTGVGAGLAVVPLLVVATGQLAPQDAAGGSSLALLAHQAGGWLAAPVFAFVVAGEVVRSRPSGGTTDGMADLERATLSGYWLVLWVAAGLAVAGALAGLLVTARRPRPVSRF